MASVNLNQVARQSMETAENVALWKQQVENLASLIKAANNKYLVNLNVDFGGLCPYLAFIRLDALDKKDYPNNISDNSIFLDFEIDLIAHKVELFRSGHVYLSEKDLATERYKFYAMKSMVNVGVDYGMCKKFRKSSYKTIEQLAKKIVDYFDIVMQATEKYTNGYPYKNGIEKP